jgi:hypothetical protein
VKFDPQGEQHILNECLFMKNHCNGLKFSAPRYVIHNTQNSRRYLVMQFLEYDLEDYICSFPAGEKRDKVIQRLALEMLEIVG